MQAKKITTKCDHCGKKTKKTIGHYNRAKKLGARMFCNRKCFGLFWRSQKTEQDKKDEKSFYDAFYRHYFLEKRRKQGKEWFDIDYKNNPDKYKKIRKAKQKEHNAYCMRPEYREYKKKYDETHRAKKEFGPFWEASILLNRISDIVDNRAAKQMAATSNKTKKRKQLQLCKSNSLPSISKTSCGKH